MKVISILTVLLLPLMLAGCGDKSPAPAQTAAAPAPRQAQELFEISRFGPSDNCRSGNFYIRVDVEGKYYIQDWCGYSPNKDFGTLAPETMAKVLPLLQATQLRTLLDTPHSCTTPSKSHGQSVNRFIVVLDEKREAMLDDTGCEAYEDADEVLRLESEIVAVVDLDQLFEKADSDNHLPVYTGGRSWEGGGGCHPMYPRKSAENEEQGTVRVKFDVGTNNNLITVKIVKSSGFKALDDAVLEGLKTCSFKSARKNGAPIEASLMMDYVFTLPN